MYIGICVSAGACVWACRTVCFLPPFYKGQLGQKVKARGDLFCVVRIFTKCKGSK